MDVDNGLQMAETGFTNGRSSTCTKDSETDSISKSFHQGSTFISFGLSCTNEQITNIQKPSSHFDEIDVDVLRQHYGSLDKVKVEFNTADFDSRVYEHIVKIRCHLNDLFETRNITLLDPEFMKLTLDKFNAIDSRTVKQNEIKRRIAGLMLSRKNPHLPTVKRAKYASKDVINEEEHQKVLSPLLANAKPKETKMARSLATWDDDAISEKWNSIKMRRFHREARNYVIDGFLENHDYHLNFQKQTVPKSKKTSFFRFHRTTDSESMPKLSESPEDLIGHVRSQAPSPLIVPQKKTEKKKKSDKKKKAPVPPDTASSGPPVSIPQLISLEKTKSGEKMVHSRPVKSKSSTSSSQIIMPQLISHEKTKSGEKTVSTRPVKSNLSTISSQIAMPQLISHEKTKSDDKTVHTGSITSISSSDKPQEGILQQQHDISIVEKRKSALHNIQTVVSSSSALITSPLSSFVTESIETEKTTDSEINSILHSTPSILPASNNMLDYSARSNGSSEHLSRSSSKNESGHQQEKTFEDTLKSESDKTAQ